MNKNFKLPKNIFFIGIGGIHMSAIAKLLLQRGHNIIGTDTSQTKIIEHLKSIGIKIYSNHEEKNVKSAELVIFSSAIDKNNPEIVFAQKNEIPLMSRAQILNALCDEKDMVAISGSHGKTTISSLLGFILLQAKHEPLIMTGGLSKDIGQAINIEKDSLFYRNEENMYDGSGKIAIIEADEYKEAFLSYSPMHILINNIDADHLDYFGSKNAIIDSFNDFANSLHESGTLFINKDSIEANEIGLKNNQKKIEYYSIEKRTDWQAKKITGNKNDTTSFEVYWKGSKLGIITTNLIGRHNVTNIIGCVAVAMQLGIGFQQIQSAIQQFQGIDRRFSIYKHPNDVIVVDDYAHHPTEIKATIAATKTKFPGYKIITCFQPHTFSRTQYLLEDFKHSFEHVNQLIIVPTFAARETENQGINSKKLHEEIVLENCILAPSIEFATKKITENITSKTVILVLGAGDIYKLIPKINEILGRQE
ncbi:MAG: UDP-N-acetylmuramate--L-alanine ligase [Chloroflexi bacterium]|nr:UDP-N-acetylmuramate--L-alanine ligase [Chloroflexota bacterium]|tara:strand:- start:227 stop:1657 length:1431 start_codon:yes stop_codon:yes gene_type:complete